MIPLKLSIQNFLSYGPHAQIIDFTPYRLMCLSGKNGHGKSALLDAITWVLWGQARKISASTKPDYGLLRLGQTDMVVALDLIFNDQKYRVKRLFSTKHGKHTTYLDFGTYDKETDHYRSLTEKTLRKTQEKIEQVIGLDYESFINSSFLRQGQANEFSKKLPKERKDVLANILGLYKYEKTKKYALEKIRLINQEKEKLSKISEHLSNELQHLPLITERLSENTALLHTLLKQEQTADVEKKELESRRMLLFKKQSEFKATENEYALLEKQKIEKESEFRALVLKWKEVHKRHLLLSDKKRLHEKKEELTQQLQLQQQEFQTILEHKEKFLSYKLQEQELTASLRKNQEQALYEKRLSIERLHAQQTMTLKEQEHLEKTKTTVTFEIKKIDQEIASLQLLGQSTTDSAFLITDTAFLEKQFERQKNFYLTWAQQGKRIHQELESLSHKKQLAHSLDNQSCPLCEQNLSLARKRFLAKKFEDQEFFLIHHLARIKKVLGTVKTTIEKQKETIALSKKTDALLREQTALTEQLLKIDEALKTHVDTSKNQKKDLALLHHELEALQKEIETTITKNTEIISLKTKQQACEKILEKGATLSTAMAATTEQLATITKTVEQLHFYQQEQEKQKERKATIAELARTIRTFSTKETHLKKLLLSFALLSEEENKQQEQEKEHVFKLQELLKTKEAALQEKGNLEAQYKKLQQQAIHQKECALSLISLQQDIEEYHLIAQAFGKDGIQALLIEDALPEIEHEANDLLSRLTDNQAHIFIESLRDLKKGGVKETLDINISDTTGIRPYELFSGGEAFRIDFSLRIAISKLLARRSGTSLQTLIIDEGFGSQDEEGLGKIMDALYKIQNDFEKIIIVSHLSAMKDQFPVHFTIEKNPQGSRVSVRRIA